MLRTETVSPELLDLIRSLCAEPACAEFNLVGGTALSLQIGHRISTDIDLFSFHGFDAAKLFKTLENRYTISTPNIFNNTIMAFFNGIKTDLIAHQYPQMFPLLTIDGVRMLDMREIGAMKLNAILGNGTRLKDFIDMYFLLEHYPLANLIETYVAKYPHVNTEMACNALVYFDDIDFEVPIQYVGTELPFKLIAERLTAATRQRKHIFPSLTNSLLPKQRQSSKKGLRK